MDFRRRQFKRFLVTFVFIVVAYLGYAMLAAPWIEGPRRSAISGKTPSEFDPSRFKADLVAWLPEDAWERQPCKQVSTRSGHIFFQDYRPYDDGRVEVRPLTIILQQAGAAAGQPPIILRAPEGAILQLDRPLSLGGVAVQMESGQLLGPVTLFRAATQANGQDEWLITTSQIQLSKQKIQTIQDVDFRFGPHVGHGRNFILEFESDPLRAQQTTMTGIRGARRVELVQVDRLHLVPGTTAKETDEEQRIRGLTTPSGQELGTAGNYTNGFDVTCNGPFEFDLMTNVATLSDHVKIVSSDHADDWLSADQIALQLGPSPSAADPAAIDEASPEPEKSRQWSLQNIVALGQPAELHSAARQFSVRGERLTYSLAQQTVEVSGARGVELQQANLELTAADAQYQITADGSLGAAKISGPGMLRRGALEDQPPVEIRWRDQLTIGQDAGQKMVALVGDAKVLIDGRPQIAADQLQVWLWELPLAETNSTADQVAGVTTAPSDPGSSDPARPAQRWSWHPDRLLAGGHVQLESARMTGNFDELQAQWPRPDPNKIAATPARNAQVSAAPVSSPDQSPGRDLSSPGATAQAKPESKVTFQGKTAVVQMLDATAGAFREAVIEGNVRVQQSAPQGGVALDITGHRLQITPQDAQRFRLSVSGSNESPSCVQAQQMRLVGQMVQVDQTANRLWIDGPGQLRAVHAPPPAQADPKDSAASDVAASTVNSGPTTVDVKWSGGMIFNGQQIYLESNVTTICDQPTESGASRIAAKCAAINLTLTSFVDMSGTASTTQPVDPQVELLTLIGQIPDNKRVFQSVAIGGAQDSVELLRQSFDADQKMVSLQKMSVPWGQINAVSGALNMSGPGAVSLSSVGRGSDFFQTAERTAGPEEAASSQLTNTQIRFETSLTGNIKQSELVFAGKVRTVHGPVDDWNQSLDADRPVTRGDYYRLRSDQLQITQWQRSSAESAHVEIIALGQAQFEGATFEALAERIGYNQSQEKVILEGDPRNGAQLTYQTTPGGPRNPLVASKIAFNLRDNTTQVEGFKHGVLTTGPILKRR